MGRRVVGLGIGSGSVLAAIASSASFMTLSLSHLAFASFFVVVVLSSALTPYDATVLLQNELWTHTTGRSAVL